MPEIKIKHVVSFSSEDKVHKAENLIQPETYRQWKCATPGEKSATVVLQFEKATQINSIDIGNAGSAFVEVLVGRSSDTVSDYKVLLVASSFMSPIESRCGTHLNRVRMFGPEKLSQSTKDEKWDCVQIVCTQPFNSRTTYGLSFVKFHSPGEKVEEQSKSSEHETAVTRIGAFKLRNEDEDENDSVLTAGSWFEKKKTQISESSSNSTVNKTGPSYASVVLASASDANKMSPRANNTSNNSQKRKIHETKDSSDEPAGKKAFYAATAPKKGVFYDDDQSDEPEHKKVPETNRDLKKKNNEIENKVVLNTSKKEAPVANSSEKKKTPQTTPMNSPSASNKAARATEKVPFGKIMDKVVFVLSGFVNPLRSTIRDKALEMGAKYKGDWDRSCTHLVCAFLNTPKYVQVKQLNGKIVSKEWIFDCYKMKKPLPWTKYRLDNPAQDSSNSEESEYSEEEIDDSDEDPDYSDEEEYTDKKKKKRKKRQNNNAKKVKTKPATPTKKDASVKNDLSASSEEDQQKISTREVKSKPTTPNNKNQVSAAKNDLSASDEEDEPKTPSKNILNVSTSQNHPNVLAKRGSPGASNKNNLSDTSQSPTLLQTKDESETEDEEALRDYLADTDPDVDSGGDTEDEIRKFEEEMQKNGGHPSKKSKISEEDSGCLEKPDVSDLPLPELPNLFKQKHFFLFGKFSPSKQHDLNRYIVAYNGVVEDYMSNNVKYVITEAKWDKEFDDAVNENEDLIFVKPAWIYKCHDAGKLVPYQPFIVIPDS